MYGEDLHGRRDDERQAADHRVLVFLCAVFQRRGRRLLGTGVVGEPLRWSRHGVEVC